MPFSGSPLLIAFKQQRNAAKTRGIPFLLTFEQWLKIWTDSGHLDERGRLSHQYVMARKGDVGPYSVKNVYIITAKQNGYDGHIDKKLPPLSNEAKQKISKSKKGIKTGPLPEETKHKISRALTGKTRSQEHCQNISKARTGKKWTLEQRQRMSDSWHEKRNTMIPFTKFLPVRKKYV